MYILQYKCNCVFFVQKTTFILSHITKKLWQLELLYTVGSNMNQILFVDWGFTLHPLWELTALPQIPRAAFRGLLLREGRRGGEEKGKGGRREREFGPPTFRMLPPLMDDTVRSNWQQWRSYIVMVWRCKLHSFSMTRLHSCVRMHSVYTLGVVLCVPGSIH